MVVPLSAALADPQATAEQLLESPNLFGVEAVTGRQGCAGAALFDLTLRPMPPLAAEGWPVERARIVICADEQVLTYVLSGRERRFKHRNSWPPDRSLCLDYPRDDPALRWFPEDGLEALVTRVHRHLIFEEQWRRTGQWPVEDAPHGDIGGAPHPVLSREMREEAARWRR